MSRSRQGQIAAIWRRLADLEYGVRGLETIIVERLGRFGVELAGLRGELRQRVETAEAERDEFAREFSRLVIGSGAKIGQLQQITASLQRQLAASGEETRRARAELQEERDEVGRLTAALAARLTEIEILSRAS